MIRLLVTLSALFLLHPILGAESRLVAFERGKEIWVSSIDGTGAKKITRGAQPNISPDGTRIAFNTDADGALNRQIAVADIATKKVTVFKKEIPSDNCQHAVWSPDGSKILFNLHADDDWFVGLINADGTGFRYLKKAPGGTNSMWSACWAPDGKSIYVQNLDEILKLNLEGMRTNSWELKKVFPDGGLSSASHMAVSPDGDVLVLDVEMAAEDADREDWDGPPPSIWALELDGGKVTRLTPKGFFGWSATWLSNDKILFVSQGPEEKQPSIYRTSRQGENRKQVLKNADAPSVSR